jgi:SAM-dependent methyltransferase
LAIRERVLDGARVGPNTTVVDVGAGTGLLTLGAVERVPPDGTIFAVDPSVDSLDEIRRISTYGGVYYLIGEAAVLPLPDACADAVVTRSVLIHVEDLASVAGEFARVLRPGGRASLFEPVGRKGTYAADVIDWSGLGELGDRVRVESREFIEEHDPLSRFDDDVLVEFLATNGFEQVERDLEEWDTSWEVTPEAVEIRMNAIAAPGQPSTKGRWVSSFGPEAAERVLAHVKSLAGTRAETRVVTAHVTAVRT